MKKEDGMRFLFLTAVAILLSLLVGCSESGSDRGEVDMSDESSRRGYALGMDIGAYLAEMDADVDLAAFTRAIQDQLEGNEPLLEASEAEAIRMQFVQQARQQQMQEMQDMAQDNLEQGASFLEQNKQNPEVTTTESGLQYMVLEEGDGPKPKATDQVTVHYRGTLIDGNEFDSSYSRGQPATFPLDGVIPGWTEGVQLMNVGSKYRFFVPPDFRGGAYFDQLARRHLA
jgi:FKBP-type peptidyl-prolyl cis-trans isomerase FkpA/FKBP-type peptidyl-prolyl cis-trans isomerase FklB